VTWELWQEDLPASEWDGLLIRAADAHPLQFHFWGEYRRMAGWEPVRYVAKNKNGAVAGMAQVLVKKILGVHVAWIAGTVAMQFQGADWHSARRDLLESLVDKLKSGWKRCYIRFNFLVPHDHDYSFELGHICSRPLFRLAGGYSAIIPLDKDNEGLAKDFSSKHRYYVKKSLKHEITWRSGNDPELASHMAMLLQEIVSSKKVNAIYSSPEEIGTLCRLAGEHVVMLVGYMDGRPVTACMAIIAGSRAFYQIAATGDKGREISAAYAMIWHLLPLLKAQGVTHFDFGGLNPQDKGASGVSHFKRGFGGAVVEYLGEWECASSEMLRLGVNLGIWKRGGRL